MLTRVTLTGADDLVDPKALLALSAEFPFVEWGILLSPKRLGTPRYPSLEWIDSLEASLRSEAPTLFELAAHFCGEATRTTLDGGEDWLDHASWANRIQLNGYEAPARSFRDWAFDWAQENATEFILQVRSDAELEGVATDARDIGSTCASILYDPSGGRGIEPFRWPAPLVGVAMGYAGGITPDNVVDVLGAIAEARLTTPSTTSYWIDMESGVRTNDRFDLAKVRAVLERARPYVREA